MPLNAQVLRVEIQKVYSQVVDGSEEGVSLPYRARLRGRAPRLPPGTNWPSCQARSQHPLPASAIR
jgi:hypothetical protein